MFQKRRHARLERLRQELQYSGKYYQFSGNEKKRKQLLIALWIDSLAAFFSVLAGGCIPTPGLSGSFYLLIPYVAALISGGAVLWAVAQLSLSGNPLRAYAHLLATTRLPRRALAMSISTLLCLLGQILYLCLHGSQGHSLSAVLFMVFQVFAALAAFDLRHRISRETWAECPDG